MAAAKKQATSKKALAKKPKKSTKKKVAPKPVIVQRSRLSNRLSKPLRTRLKTPRARRLVKLLESPAFGRAYVIAALVILLASTVFWALLGSKLQQSNTDQLVNAYLFQDSRTLSGASFPAQHTFLFKWPLFYLVKLFGYTAWSYAYVTIETCLATVVMLAAILYRIERRPLVYGTLCLALTSVMLLVPAQPYAGALLPVNMAMLATRNLEYILYVAGLWLLIRAVSIKSWHFAGGIILLGLLIASDKLFLAFSIGGALLAIGFYVTTGRWKVARVSIRWLAGAILAAVVGFGVIALVAATKVTHIAGGGIGPYGVVNNAKDLALGAIYAVSGLATNLGANPGFDSTQLSQFPTKIVDRLWGVGGFSFLVNILIAGYGLRATYGVIRTSLVKVKAKKPKPDYAQQLAGALIFTTLAAVGVFMSSKHYYAVDARYLSVSLFAVFVAMASFGRKKHWNSIGLLALGVALAVSVALGSLSAAATYREGKQALSVTDQRNARVAQALKSHQVSTLVGDYWRVLPIKSKAGGSLPVTPLQDCVQPRGALSSMAWQKNLNGHSFAYLLSFDKSLTDFPKCDLNQVVSHYGRPNISTLIDGTLSSPKEVLLFYDDGIQDKVKIADNARLLSTVLPISLNELPYTSCGGPSVMNIVAHQDDDLLFMNPDLLHAIAAGDCVRTIYVTAGDGGNVDGYWQSREQGSEAAYDNMLGKDYTWYQRIVKLDDGHFVTVASPMGDSRISLIFMRLPDGNLRGEGFGRSHHESLAHLSDGSVRAMRSVDNQSSYTSGELDKALASLVRTFKPSEIHTQSSFSGSEFPDHSDHRAVSFYAKRAHGAYQNEQLRNNINVPIRFYMGYPIHALSDNLTPEDLAAKESAFLAYSRFDGSVCKSAEDCSYTPTYGSYLPRQYENSY